MAKIKIINGVYGMRINGYTVEKKTPEDAPFDVPDCEAERLVGMGVAAYAVEPEQPIPETTEELPSYNDGMTLGELKKAAEAYGVDASKCKSKASVISMIDAALNASEDEAPSFEPVLPV
ncbi:MAG: response regulator receiver protein [Clostridia bacterium]|nr:response regulator receiver protein [Clostridia bacterium]